MLTHELAAKCLISGTEMYMANGREFWLRMISYYKDRLHKFSAQKEEPRWYLLCKLPHWT